MKVIQEEVTDDNEVLPLWEGKVMAQVKTTTNHVILATVFIREFSWENNNYIVISLN